MIFTNQIEINEKDICYYRKAYSPEIFDTLSIDEKRSLIAFTVEEFSNDTAVAYSDELCDEIGALTEQDVLLINNKTFLNPNQTYSLELYLFLYDTLMKRFVARKKNFVPVIAESYINKKWRKKDYRSDPLDMIILHLLLDELLEMNEVVLVGDEERKYCLEEIDKISNRLLQAQGVAETVHMESSQKLPNISETNDIRIARKR